MYLYFIILTNNILQIPVNLHVIKKFSFAPHLFNYNNYWKRGIPGLEK